MLEDGHLDFGASTSAKQLGSIIDKLTYLGTCDLFLDPEEISLRTRLRNFPAAFTGVILARQIESLESSLWKEGVRSAIKVLLAHSLEIHEESEMPIQKARTLIRCLDFMYHSSAENVDGMGWHVEQMGREVEMVLCNIVSTFFVPITV
jgi:separase